MESVTDRQERFFGEEGQAKIADCKIAIIGVGGLGTIVCQQLAYLRVGTIYLFEDEELDRTNLNRYVTARHKDPIPGTHKNDIAIRMINEIDPSIRVVPVPGTFPSEYAYKKLKEVDYVFGCLDNDGSRQVLLEYCCQFEKPYIDMASDIISKHEWGGRVFVSFDENGCLHCFDELDQEEVDARFESPEERKTRESIYGISKDDLDEKGPSVISLNGIIASLGVTEFICMVTGLRPPKRKLTYRGGFGPVSDGSNQRVNTDCIFCKSTRGGRNIVELMRFLKPKP